MQEAANTKPKEADKVGQNVLGAYTVECFLAPPDKIFWDLLLQSYS